MSLHVVSNLDPFLRISCCPIHCLELDKKRFCGKVARKKGVFIVWSAALFGWMCCVHLILIFWNDIRFTHSVDATKFGKMVLFITEWRQGSPLLLTWAEMSTVVLDYKASVKILFVNCLIFQKKKFGLWYLWMCAACSRTTFTGDQLCLCLKGLVVIAEVLVGFSNTVYHDNNTTKKTQNIIIDMLISDHRYLRFVLLTLEKTFCV